MILEAVTIISLFTLAFGLISGRIEKSILTPPMIFATFGLLISPFVSQLLNLSVDSEVVDIIATTTLVFVLFTDASRIDFKLLKQQYQLPLRLLGIGLPLTIVLGSGFAIALFPQLNIWEAAAVATILAPTDAALGQAVVNSPNVPVRIRQALNIESGLNDGICLPILLIFLSLAESVGGEQAVASWGGFAIAQLVMGPVVGILVGYLGGQLIATTTRTHWMTENYQRLSLLSLAALAFCLAEPLGGNGFIAAFSAGLTLGNTHRELCPRLYEYGETEGQFFILVTFVIFGGLMVVPVLPQIQGQVMLYAVLSLTAARILSVSLCLVGMKLRWDTQLFLGWFGPRGVASILYVLMVLNRDAIQGREQILSIVVSTVLLSIFAHGLSAFPGANWYAQRVEKDKSLPTAEHQTVAEMPVRLPYRSRYRQQTAISNLPEA